MELLWLRYQRENTSKYLTLLLLGEHEGKYVGVDSKEASPGEAAIIRKFASHLDGLPLNDKVAWLKQTLPNLASKALRTIRVERASIVRRFKLPATETVQPGPAP